MRLARLSSAPLDARHTRFRGGRLRRWRWRRRLERLGHEAGDLVGDVCGALQTWEDELKSGSQQLSSDIQQQHRPQVGQAEARRVPPERRAEHAEDGRRREEPPARPRSRTARPSSSDLESGLTEARGSFQRAVTQAKKLPTNDPQALTTGLSSLAQTIQSELTATGKHFSNLDEQVRRRRSQQGDGRRGVLQAVRLVVRLGVLDPEREPR